MDSRALARDAIKKAINAQNEKRTLLCKYVRAMVKRRPSGQIPLHQLRNLLRLAVGRAITRDEIVEAVTSVVPVAYAIRPAKRVDRVRRRVIKGVALRAPGVIEGLLSKSPADSVYASALKYVEHNDWTEYPPRDRLIFGAWASGDQPKTIAAQRGLPVEAVDAVLSFHRARARIAFPVR